MKNYNKQRQLVLCCMGLTDPNNLANQKINNNNNNNNNSNNNNNNNKKVNKVSAYYCFGILSSKRSLDQRADPI